MSDFTTRICRTAARVLLQGYRLNDEERAQELEALAQALQQTAEQCLENVEHRRRA